MTAPSAESIALAGDAFAKFGWGICGPLLYAPSAEVFAARFRAFATVETVKDYHRIADTRSGRAWQKQVEENQAKQALTPPKALPDLRSRELADDLVERLERMLEGIRATRQRAGSKLPTDLDESRLFARFIASFIPVAVASEVPADQATFSFDNVRRAYDEATQVITERAALWRIPTERLITERDRRLASKLELLERTAQAELDAAQAQREQLEAEELYWAAE